jgi:hypothetical protein
MTGCERPAPKDISLPDNKSQNSQWVLESYDASKGFVFSKDGVSYATKCDHIFHKSTGIRQDINDQSQCVRVLSYLHKTIPIDDTSENINGVVAFTDGDSVFVFDIKQAK